MTNVNKLKSKIYNLKTLQDVAEKWRKNGEKVVFSNGCFDIVHRGHIEVLAQSADLGSKLIVGINSDESVKNLKGKSRPIINEESRAILLASLSFIDAVILFNEATPFNLIKTLKPNVLAKGGDYSLSLIVGRDIVEANGGEVKLIPFITGYSSTGIINKIKKLK